MYEEAKGEHATQAAKGALVHGHVLGRGDVVQIDVDAPNGGVIDDDPDQEDDSHGTLKQINNKTVNIYRNHSEDNTILRKL